MRRSLLAVMVALAPVPLHGQDMPPIGIIDFYGLRALPESTARAALGIHVGDTVSSATAPRSRLRALPGVADARLNLVCCSDDGKVILFVGIAESGAPVNVFNAAPTGSVRLPEGVVRLRAMFDDTVMSAVRQGKAGERDSAGHAFFEYPAASAIQHRFLGIAAAQLPLLRDVLQHSANAEHRATAAQVLGYAPNVGDIVPDLERAIHDPDETVRNNAMRALAVIALYAQQSPSSGIRVSPAPFVDMLNSVVWTDRNKASLALYQLTASRDSALLAALRANAVPALRDIARWRSAGHAFAGFMVLGRVDGIPEQSLQQAWQKGDRSVVLGSPPRGSSGSILVNGTHLFYEEAGRGSAVILLHAGNLDRRIWDLQFARLAQEHRVVRYDLRGYGKSGPADKPFQHHEDLRVLLDSLNIGRASLVGASGGGRIAIDFALAYPERVDRLVLAAPGLSGWEYSRGDTAYFAAARVARDRGDTAALGIAWLGSAYMLPAMEHPELVRQLREISGDNGKHWMALLQHGDLERVADPPAIRRLDSLRAPTLLIVGTRDVADIQGIADTLSARVPLLHRVSVKGAGHLVNMEQPDRFTTLVLDFLRR
jgi:pimeloyl-ACP methyl ester carboxylesterase